MRKIWEANKPDVEDYYTPLEEGDSDETTYTIEDEIELKSPEKEGYIFDGWYENAEFIGEKRVVMHNS